MCDFQAICDFADLQQQECNAASPVLSFKLVPRSRPGRIFACARAQRSKQTNGTIPFRAILSFTFKLAANDGGGSSKSSRGHGSPAPQEGDMDKLSTAAPPCASAREPWSLEQKLHVAL